MNCCAIDFIEEKLIDVQLLLFPYLCYLFMMCVRMLVLLIDLFLYNKFACRHLGGGAGYLAVCVCKKMEVWHGFIA